MPTSLWDDLYESRLDWAERAYSSFLHGIDEEVARDFERKGEVTVVLYGRTQVGKTTLLLKVLGIADEHYPHVTLLLRGGRKAGQSATATATRYARSPDDYWYFGEAIDSPLNDVEMENHLANLRKGVEAGRYIDDNPVNIWIPQKYFSPRSTPIDVRILDLPGTHSTNSNEQRHVERVASRFVPAADVVLLVGKVNALGFLKPEELGLEELQYWPHSPERFKIILTHTYSDQSTKDWIASRGGLDVPAIRQQMLGQLRTHNPHLPDGLSNSLFPIEFGSSWERLSQSGDAVFSAADPVVSELFGTLTNDVLSAATKYARIRSAFNVHAAIQQKRKEDVDALRRKRQGLVASCDLLSAQLAILDEEIRQQKGDVLSIRGSLATLEDRYANDLHNIDSAFSARAEGLSTTADSVNEISPDYSRKIEA